MVWHRFPSLLPRGFYGRAALILMVPVVTIQIVLSVVFIQRHFEGVTQQMTRNIVLDLDFALQRLADAPDRQAALDELAPFLSPLQLEIAVGPEAPPAPRDDLRAGVDLSGRAVIATLRDGLAGYRAADLLSNSREVALWLDSPRGPVHVRIPRSRVSASNPHQLLVIVALASIVMTLISFVFLRNQVRPIRRLAEAADAFGKGRTVPFRPAGATEVRAAGRAFVAMRARIERQIEQRTLMLSAVSHDMRTPLTRMRLTLSLMDPSGDRDALAQDVNELQALLDSFLDFARNQALEMPEPCDPVALVGAIVARRQGLGQCVRLHQSLPGAITLTLRPQLIERALENLIANALRHGRQAEVTIELSDRGWLLLSVEDDGPGIPADRREEACRPFVRLDAARNQDRGGGVGLGLAIASDSARAHGGRLALGTSERLGGLSARLELPY